MTETKAGYKMSLPDRVVTPMVKAIGEMSFTGNIIPHAWFSTIRRENDKPDLAAIVILSDIVYWYRPAEIRDEATGAILRYERKFHADKLQRSYRQLAEMFGISKRQAADACKRLRDLGIITLELRTIKLKTGLCLSNVLFIEPILDGLYAVTFPSQEVLQKTGTPVTEDGKTTLQKTGTPVTEDGETYTETTTQNTTETTTTPIAVENLKTLLSLGCAENDKVSEIANLEGLTPSIILGVYERGKRNRRVKNLCGWLISELESGRWKTAQGYYSESELAVARADALAEEPIDVDEYLRLEDES